MRAFAKPPTLKVGTRGLTFPLHILYAFVQWIVDGCTHLEHPQKVLCDRELLCIGSL